MTGRQKFETRLHITPSDYLRPGHPEVVLDALLTELVRYIAEHSFAVEPDTYLVRVEFLRWEDETDDDGQPVLDDEGEPRRRVVTVGRITEAQTVAVSLSATGCGAADPEFVEVRELASAEPILIPVRRERIEP